MGSGKVAFEAIGIYNAPENVAEMAERYKTGETAVLLESNGSFWVFLSRGLKSTGGYAVKVSGVRLITLESGLTRLAVSYRYSDPKPSQFVTQILTYPTALILLKGLDRKPDEVVFEQLK